MECTYYNPFPYAAMFFNISALSPSPVAVRVSITYGQVTPVLYSPTLDGPADGFLAIPTCSGFLFNGKLYNFGNKVGTWAVTVTSTVAEDVFFNTSISSQSGQLAEPNSWYRTKGAPLTYFTFSLPLVDNENAEYTAFFHVQNVSTGDLSQVVGVSWDTKYSCDLFDPITLEPADPSHYLPNTSPFASSLTFKLGTFTSGAVNVGVKTADSLKGFLVSFSYEKVTSPPSSFPYAAVIVVCVLLPIVAVGGYFVVRKAMARGAYQNVDDNSGL
jgi:hypothetical protein